MKDQLKLLRDCLKDEIPAVVFQGDDACAIEILEEAQRIYQERGCSPEFIQDWQSLIDEVRTYQESSPGTVKLPALKYYELATFKPLTS